MKLSSNERKQLLKVIIDSYPDITDIEIFIKLELGENLDNIAGGSNNTQKVFKLIEWAETTGKLIDLLNAVSQDRPDNSDLQNTIKNLQEKYAQDNKVTTVISQPDPKNNNLSLVVRSCFLGIAIIVIGLTGYTIFSKPKLDCIDTPLKNQANGIKIIIPDFEGNQDPNLETSLLERFRKGIPYDVIICRQINQKIKKSSEANQIGQKLLLEDTNYILVIWGSFSELSFLGGIELINKNKFQDKNISDRIGRLVDISLHQKDPLIFKDIFYPMIDFQVAYRIALSYYSSDNQHKNQESQRLLQDTLDKVISCQVNNQQLINLNKQEVADAYSLLGDFYNKNGNFNQAIISYKCSYKFEKDIDRRDTLLLQQAENYTKLNDIDQALKLYQKVIEEGSNNSKSGALANRAMMFVTLNKCIQADKDLGEVIDKNLNPRYGLEIRAEVRLFDCPKRLDAIADLSKLCQLDPKGCQNTILYYYKVITKYNPQEYQKIVSELQEIQKTHPKWQKLINQLIEKNNSK